MGNDGKRCIYRNDADVRPGNDGSEADHGIHRRIEAEPCSDFDRDGKLCARTPEFRRNEIAGLQRTSGTGGSGAPTGLFSVSSTNDITIGTDGGALDWSLVVQFETETATDNALMDRLGYLTTPGVAGQLKTIKRDVAGNGFIWEGSGTSSTVNGYRAMATNQMPSTLTKGSGSNLHGMIFGNWAELLIGQWGGVDLLVNPYTKGKEAQIEFIINAWYDIAVRHAASFCKCDEIDIS